MNGDVPDYVRDMDHNGTVDGKDAALFHELLDAEQGSGHAGSGGSTSEPWTVYHSFAKGLLLLLFGGLLFLLLKGVLPVNAFTAVLGLLSAVCFIRTLML